MHLSEKRSSCAPRHTGLCALLLSSLAFACGDEGGGDSTALGAPATGTDPLYAMMIQVYTADDRIVYAHLTKDLEVGLVDLTQAREFPSVANFAGIGGRIYVSSGTEPVITEFGISDDLAWAEGRSVSFSGFPLDDNANFYYQHIIDEQTAYMPFDKTSRIVWNPTDMVLQGTMTDTSVPLVQGGLELATGGNRNGVRFDGLVQQPFFYTNEAGDLGAESVVALYDPETHEETGTVSLPCPGLSMASRDGGYTYYGTWDLDVQALFGLGPAPCITRLTPELTVDDAWTTNLEAVTGGRPHNNFRAVGGGKAIANVLHTEELEGASFDAGYDVDLVDQIVSSGPWWKLWLIDLETMTGAPIAGIDVDTSTGAQFGVLDGRTFVFLPYDDWGRSKIYEIGADGVAIERGDTPGDVFKWVKVR